MGRTGELRGFAGFGRGSGGKGFKPWTPIELAAYVVVQQGRVP